MPKGGSTPEVGEEINVWGKTKSHQSLKWRIKPLFSKFEEAISQASDDKYEAHYNKFHFMTVLPTGQKRSINN